MDDEEIQPKSLKFNTSQGCDEKGKFALSDLQTQGYLDDDSDATTDDGMSTD